MQIRMTEQEIKNQLDKIMLKYDNFFRFEFVPDYYRNLVDFTLKYNNKTKYIRLYMNKDKELSIFRERQKDIVMCDNLDMYLNKLYEQERGIK